MMQRSRLSAVGLVCAAAAATALGCASAPPESSVPSVVRGTAFYRERIAMPPEAVLEVTLEDVSRADAPSVTIGEARLENAGNPPYRFEIGSSQIDERNSYAVRARLLVDGELWFTTDTAYPVLTRGAGSEVELLLRRVAADRSSVASGPLGALPASFEGDLPCADCEGIRYHLDLFEDEVFFLRLTYLGRGAALDDVGGWSVGSDGTTLALHGGREAPETFRIVDRERLRKLDLEGRDISSSLNYELRRGAEFSPIEPRLVMRGMYRYMADAALFDECLTGRRFPVSMEADNVALERAYLEARKEAGEPILVSLEGRIAQRPAMEGDATVLSVVPERFIGIWPGKSCGARMTATELVGSYWKLTRLADQPVVVADQQREPHLTLTADGRVSGFDGCNRFAGSYQVAGGSIAFSQMASTKMACLDGMEHERAFADALGRARSFTITGIHLELTDADGALLARFGAVTQP